MHYKLLDHTADIKIEAEAPALHDVTAAVLGAYPGSPVRKLLWLYQKPHGQHWDNL
jgi:hypothetical protein